MENIIIEFNGIPGVGKSTICNTLYELFESKNLPYYTEKNVFKNKNSINKIFDFFSLSNLITKYLLLKLSIIYTLENKSFIYLKKSLQIIRYINVFNKFTNKMNNKCLILSEGFIQFLSNLCDGTKRLHEDIIEQIINTLYTTNSFKYFIINCNIDEQIAYERIENRKSIPNSIDLMDKKKLYKFLISRSKNLIKIRKLAKNNINVIEIDTSDSIINNINKIYNGIKSGES